MPSHEHWSVTISHDRDFANLFDYFSGLSVVISCLRLFGLSLLIFTKRRNEVGIRKVFGAWSNDIVSIFLRNYFGPRVLSLAIGVVKKLPYSRQRLSLPALPTAFTVL